MPQSPTQMLEKINNESAEAISLIVKSVEQSLEKLLTEKPKSTSIMVNCGLRGSAYCYELARKQFESVGWDVQLSNIYDQRDGDYYTFTFTL